MRRNKFKSVRRFESLENRWMMAADSFVNNGILTVQGTNNNDLIQIESIVNIEEDDDEVEVEELVRVTIQDRDTDTVLRERYYDRNAVNELVINALAGHDEVSNFTDIPSTIHGNEGIDRLTGGSANDTIYGDADWDFINGGLGDNHLPGGAYRDDYIFIGSGLGINSVYEATYEGEDWLDFSDFGGPVNLDLASTAVQVVNPGNLTLVFSSDDGMDNVIGSVFDDTIKGTRFRNSLWGSEGNDKLYGRGGSDQLEGGVGNDLFEGAEGNDRLNGYVGNDTYVYSGSNLGTDEIFEVAKADTDTLDFSNFGPNYLGLGVSVNIEAAYVGTNPLYAVNSAGTQIKLNDASGIENVIGSSYADTIVGNARNNYLFGGDEDDEITGGKGDDKREGSKGDDIYHFAGTNLGTDEIIEIANAGNDGLRFSGMTHGLTIDLSLTIYGSGYAVNETDLKLKLANDTAIERVWGTDYDDIIVGNKRNNRLYGRDGYDNIIGGDGADYLHGGDDTDWLYTDALDEVYGGLGWDNFNAYSEQTWSNPDSARYRDWGVH